MMSHLERAVAVWVIVGFTVTGLWAAACYSGRRR